jgi:putative salt-induced outer membrane protein YdiY
MKRIKQILFLSSFSLGLTLFGQDEAGPEAAAPDVTVEVAQRPDPWTGRFDVGYTWQSGRTDKSELSLRAQGDRRVGIHEYRALAEFLYGEVDGTRNAQRFTSTFRWRADLSERLFTQALTLYESDRVREIRNRVEQNVGLGYRFVKTDTMEASIVPGFTLQYTDETGVDDRWDYLASAFQDFRWRFSEAYRFEQDVAFLIDPSETDDFIVRFNAGVIGTLTESINLSIRYQYLYENETRPGLEKTDQRIIASIGYAF